MFCPECETEYREGFAICADCQVELVPELGGAPVPGDLAPLLHDGNPALIARVAERLELRAIPYVVQAGTALPLFDGEVETLDRPEPWEGRIWVTAAAQESAIAIVEEERDAIRHPHAAALFVAVWRFRPRPGKERAFERTYGPDGTWSKLFRHDPDYVRTDLLRDGDGYLTLDWWRSREAYDAFREEHAQEYARIDADAEELTSAEELVGGYEAVD